MNTLYPGFRGRMIWKADGGAKRPAVPYIVDRHKSVHSSVDRKQELLALLQTHGTLTDVARHLHISRQAVHSKIKRWGIDYHTLKNDFMVVKRAPLINDIVYYVYGWNMPAEETAAKLGITKAKLNSLLGRYISVQERFRLRRSLKKRIAKNLFLLRMEKNITQEELGKIVGLFQEYFSGIESGMHLPENRTLNKIAQALDVPLERILKPRRRDLCRYQKCQTKI